MYALQMVLEIRLSCRCKRKPLQTGPDLRSKEKKKKDHFPKVVQKLVSASFSLES